MTVLCTKSRGVKIELKVNEMLSTTIFLLLPPSPEMRRLFQFGMAVSGGWASHLQ